MREVGEKTVSGVGEKQYDVRYSLGNRKKEYAMSQEQFSVPLFERTISEVILELVPESVVREHFVIPVDHRDEKLTIACPDERFGEAEQAFMRFVIEREIEWEYHPLADVKKAIRKHYGVLPGDIENCRWKFQFQCPLTWDQLSATESPDIRFCSVCSQNVYRCDEHAEVIERAQLGQCVSLGENWMGLLELDVPVCFASEPHSKQPLSDQLIPRSVTGRISATIATKFLMVPILWNTHSVTVASCEEGLVNFDKNPWQQIFGRSITIEIHPIEQVQLTLAKYYPLGENKPVN